MNVLHRFWHCSLLSCSVFISWLDLGLETIFLPGESWIGAVLRWLLELDCILGLLELFPWLWEDILLIASEIAFGDTHSSGSQSRKPFANGLLAIFNWVELKVRNHYWLLLFVMYNRTLSLQSNIKLPIKIFGFYKTDNVKTSWFRWSNKIIT